MRVVLDTNTIISGLLWSGHPRTILNTARQHRIQLFTSQILLDELADVLARDKFAHRLQRGKVRPESLVIGFRALAILVEPSAIPPTILDDPDDDAVLACAVTPQAQAIVSGDSHLLKLSAYAGIPILTAADLVEQHDW